MFIVFFTIIMILFPHPCCCCCEFTSTYHTAGLVAALKQFYHSSCAFLIHTHNSRSSERTLNELRRLISEQMISTSMVLLKIFNHTQPEFQCRNSLNIILSTDHQAREALCKLSNKNSLSGSIWLLLLDSSMSPEEFLADCDIPFDCEFIVGQKYHGGSVLLKEMYRVEKGLPLRAYNFGYWKSENDFKFTPVEFFRRRSSLDGLFIPAATIENPPITELEESEQGIRVKGFFGKIWSILEEKMNFTSNFTIPEDGARGLVMENGTANGMIKMVQDEEVHMAVDAFGFSGIRAKAIDFTVPLLSTRYCVLVRSPDSTDLQWNNFLSPFSLMLWIAMMVTVLVIAFHLTLLYYLGQRYGNQEAEELKFYTFSDSLLFVLGIFCQQGHELTPRSYSCRFVCISTYIIAVMIFGTYSATFISFLTVHNNKLPYTNIKSLILDGGYTFGVTSVHAQNYISEASRNFLKERFNGKYPEIHMSVLDGMERVCRSKHSLLVPLDTALAFKNKVGCNVVPLQDETSLFIPQGMAIAKNSPYKGLFNYNLNRLRSNGVMYKLRVTDNVQTFSKENILWTRVGLEEVAPIISLLLAGILASVVVLILERVTPRRLMLFQQSGGVFCCIASVRYISTSTEESSSTRHYHFSEILQMEGNPPSQ